MPSKKKNLTRKRSAHPTLTQKQHHRTRSRSPVGTLSRYKSIPTTEKSRRKAVRKLYEGDSYDSMHSDYSEDHVPTYTDDTINREILNLVASASDPTISKNQLSAARTIGKLRAYRNDDGDGDGDGDAYDYDDDDDEPNTKKIFRPKRTVRRISPAKPDVSFVINELNNNINYMTAKRGKLQSMLDNPQYKHRIPKTRGEIHILTKRINDRKRARNLLEIRDIGREISTFIR